MKLTCVKVENCFAGSQTYEYRLPVSAEQFAARLEGWQLRENRRLRRPVFLAERDGIKIKGILAGNQIRVSYPDSHWESDKVKLEAWMEALYV